MDKERSIEWKFFERFAEIFVDRNTSPFLSRDEGIEAHRGTKLRQNDDTRNVPPPLEDARRGIASGTKALNGVLLITGTS